LRDARTDAEAATRCESLPVVRRQRAAEGPPRCFSLAPVNSSCGRRLRPVCARRHVLANYNSVGREARSGLGPHTGKFHGGDGAGLARGVVIDDATVGADRRATVVAGSVASLLSAKGWSRRRPTPTEDSRSRIADRRSTDRPPQRTDGASRTSLKRSTLRSAGGRPSIMPSATFGEVRSGSCRPAQIPAVSSDSGSASPSRSALFGAARHATTARAAVAIGIRSAAASGTPLTDRRRRFVAVEARARPLAERVWAPLAEWPPAGPEAKRFQLERVSPPSADRTAPRSRRDDFGPRHRWGDRASRRRLWFGMVITTNREARLWLFFFSSAVMGKHDELRVPTAATPLRRPPLFIAGSVKMEAARHAVATYLWTSRNRLRPLWQGP